MKKIIIFLLILNCYNSIAQFGLKVIYVRPTGELGMTMKPAFSAELMYKSFNSGDEDDSNWQTRFGIGFIKFTPRMESFPVVGLIVSQSTTVSPGTMSYSKYNLTYLYGGVDYELELHPKFFLYPGMDISFGGVTEEYQAHYETISDEGYSGGSVFIGFRARFGAEYRINDNVAIFTEANRSMNLIPHEAFFAYNDYGFGFRLRF